MLRWNRLAVLTAIILSGCSPSQTTTETSSAAAQSGDDQEVWSRCGPVAGDVEDCLSLARRYASGVQENKPACLSTIGTKDDNALANLWLTLGPNGADKIQFEQFRQRRYKRFTSAATIAVKPAADMTPVLQQAFSAEYADCWNTYAKLRGLHPSVQARDAFIDRMMPFISYP